MSAAPAPDPAATPDLDVLGFRFSFFKLVVRDLDATRDFYVRALGFEQQGAEIAMPGLREAMLTRPGDRFTLVLFQHTDGREVEMGGAYGPVGFVTRDVDAAVAHLLAHGARAGRGPFALPSMRIAFVYDPEGHEIELIQPTRPAQEQKA